VVYAARTEPQASGTPKSYATGVILVEKALYREGYTSIPVDGHYGTVTKTAYARWQYRLGYRGSDANGIPGAASLAALGRKSGLFRVVA
jgi:peptidoglycan hydrolase-like protein with peptidoglycan-binding domain